MELHLALKNIIETDGVEVVKDIRIVNILSDFNAFDAIPASKYILRAIITDGYSEELLAIGEWNSKSLTLCQKFASLTGFQYDYVKLVFQSIAYGLNYTDKIDSTLSNNNIKNDVTFDSSSKLSHSYKTLIKKTPKYKEQFKEDAEEYLDNITEIKGDWMNEFGVSAVSSSFFILNSNGYSIKFRLEINGKISCCYDKLYLFIKVVLYNKKGKIIATQVETIHRDNYSRSYQVVDFMEIPDDQFKNIANISKVIIYWY